MLLVLVLDGVHVIHQLTQAGRTLVAFLLNCQAESLRPLITPALDALRSCVGLLKRFSNRYICGLRSGDLMEEFCRSTYTTPLSRLIPISTTAVSIPFPLPLRLRLLSHSHTTDTSSFSHPFPPLSAPIDPGPFPLIVTQIPLDTPSLSQEFPQTKPLPPWIRPVRKKTPSAPRSSGSHESPQDNTSEAFSPSDMFVDLSVLPPDKIVPSNGLPMNSPTSPLQRSSTISANGNGFGSGSTVPTSPRQYTSVANHAPHFMDTSGGVGDPLNIKSDPALALTPAEIMALFNDGGMDMASLFPSSLPSEFLGDDLGAGGNTLYSQSTSTAFGKGRRASGSNGDLSGLVSTP